MNIHKNFLTLVIGYYCLSVYHKLTVAVFVDGLLLIKGFDSDGLDGVAALKEFRYGFDTPYWNRHTWVNSLRLSEAYSEIVIAINLSIFRNMTTSLIRYTVFASRQTPDWIRITVDGVKRT